MAKSDVLGAFAEALILNQLSSGLVVFVDGDGPMSRYGAKQPYRQRLSVDPCPGQWGCLQKAPSLLPRKFLLEARIT